MHQYVKQINSQKHFGRLLVLVTMLLLIFSRNHGFTREDHGAERNNYEPGNLPNTLEINARVGAYGIYF